ncbi:hypothetical protein SAMN00790413_04729 [Deinococcus hopiensis KR-140]|uniref:Uncharacterized protein n=1 Tax=Deinococcus hopiensis KR-140 TaxID=695939 RepID=A0A1W1UM56_9DEIO|nr:hypothetical protein SAMN00790413_04729 [Deinococcus hopiensis KR-140]
MSEPGVDVLCTNRLQSGSNGRDEAVDCSTSLRSDGRLDLREHQLDRIKVWTIRRKEQDPTTLCFNKCWNRRSMMRRQVVHDNDLSWLQDRTNQMADVPFKRWTVDGTSQNERDHRSRKL